MRRGSYRIVYPYLPSLPQPVGENVPCPWNIPLPDPQKKSTSFLANFSYIPGGPCHAGYPLEFQHLMNVGYFFGFFVKGLPCHRAFKVGISRMQQSQKSFEPYYFLWFVCCIWLNSKKSFWVFLPWDSWILTGHMPVHRQTNPSGLSHFWALSPYISLNEAVLSQCKPREVNSTMYGVSESYKTCTAVSVFFCSAWIFFSVQFAMAYLRCPIKGVLL